MKMIIEGAIRAIENFNCKRDVLGGCEFAQQIGYYQAVVPTNNYYDIRDYFDFIYHVAYYNGGEAVTEISEEVKKEIKDLFENFSGSYDVEFDVEERYKNYEVARKYYLTARLISRNDIYLKAVNEYCRQMLSILKKIEL